jgi:hypothetical protein
VRKILLALVVSLASPGFATAAQTTTLLTPSGQSVGGQWQRWMDDSYAPTLNGPMVLAFAGRTACEPGYDPPPSDIAACTAGGAFTPVAVTEAQDPETLINTFQVWGQPLVWQRWVLMYEQGHAFDFAYLTPSSRAALLTLWGQPPLPVGEQMAAYWWQGEATGDADTPTYGEWFSEAYSLCALYRDWDRRDLRNSEQAGRESAYTVGYPGWGPSREALRIQRRTCALVRAILPTALPQSQS